MMQVFDAIERTDVGFESAGGFFADLNKSARSEVAEVRQWIEEWFAAYPTDHQTELRNGLRSTDDSAFRSAYFELLLHELMRHFGFDLTVHPDVPGTTKHPDFLLEGGKDLSFYVEAKARSVFEDEKLWQDHLQDLRACINDCTSSDHTVLVEEFQFGNGSFPNRRVTRHVSAMLADAAPRPFDHNGWYIDFALSARTRESRHETFGGGKGVVQWVDDTGPIRRAVKEKASRYGKPDKPYVIAIQALGNVLHNRKEDTFGRALFGDQALVARERGRVIETVPNGSWTQGMKPRHRRVSGVLAFDGNWPLPRQGAHYVRYFPNPWANRALLDPFPRLSRYEVQDDGLAFVEGEDVRAVLGL